MKVDPNDGTCRSCGGELEITEADDATIKYWPEVMARKELGDDEQ